MTKNKPLSREFLACHEAGHVVVALARGHEVEGVSIVADLDGSRYGNANSRGRAIIPIRAQEFVASLLGKFEQLDTTQGEPIEETCEKR